MIKLTEAQILGAIIAYLLGVFIVPIVIYFSDKAGLVDVPNERKIHHGKISRLGGVAIWISIMLTFLSLVLLSKYPSGQGLSGIIAGGSLMFLLGLVDDIYCLDAKFKLFIQIAIATVVILLGVRIESIYTPFSSPVELGFWSYPITLLWIVGISNAINFIDGIDGLAGSVVTISSFAIGIISMVVSPASPISALVAFILLGAMLSFLAYNYNPAKIFMGDSGALFAGFLLATISITGVMKVATLSILLPFVVLAVPIIDITYASLRRICKGQSPFVADAEHIHHKLLHAGFSQKKTVVILTSVAILAGGLACLFASHNAIKYYFYLTIALVGIMLLLNLGRVLTKK